MTPEYPIAFIRLDGLAVLAETPADHRGWRIDGANHRVRELRWDPAAHRACVRVRENAWIARDALGRVVTDADLPRPARVSACWATADERARGAAARGLPIPGTGRARRGRRRRCRTVLRLIGEVAAAASLRDDLREWGVPEAMIRPARDVPFDPWEDGDMRYSQRCWKEQRRSRWR